MFKIETFSSTIIYIAAGLLRLHSISLTQFKNYSNRSFAFNDRITAICGNNGVGKTNLLDAIHYLCFTKSYFTRDHINVQQGRQGFRIEGELELNGKAEKAVCILRETGKKEFLINDIAYERFAHHIGHYPCVIIAPDDIQIIIGGSEERRRLLDALLSQLNAEYLQQLIAYYKILQQRNSLLKSLADQGKKPGRMSGSEGDFALLDVMDVQLAKPGEYIFEKRKEFLVAFLPEVKKLYLEIAKQYEDITLLYQSEMLQLSFAELMMANRNKDISVQRTTGGIHRDDLVFSLDNQPFRNIASQGQRKSLLFALKLTETDVLKDSKGFAPILLLDDVFEKLDEERINSLLQRVCAQNDGQVFITDTNEERLKQHLESLSIQYQLIGL